MNLYVFVQTIRSGHLSNNFKEIVYLNIFLLQNDVTINSYGNETKSLVWQPRKRRLSGNFSERSQKTAENRLTELMSSDKQLTQSVKYLHTIEVNI